MKWNKIIILLTVIAVLITIPPFTFYYFQYTHDLSNMPAVRYAYQKNLFSILFIIAEKNNYFTKEKVNVVRANYMTGRDGMTAMLNGDVDMTNVATVPIVDEAHKKSEVSILATFLSSYSLCHIIGHKDRGINSVMDLKGKTIGVVKGTISEMYLDFFLIHHKILPNDIKKVNIKPNMMDSSIVNGYVDAISIWEPLKSKALSLMGESGISFPRVKIYKGSLSIISTNDYIKNNKKTITKVLKAIYRAEKFYHNNKEASYKMLADDTGIDIDIIRFFYTYSTAGIKLEKGLLKEMERDYYWMNKHGYVKGDKSADFMNFINTEVLKELSPEAVTIE